MAGYEELVTELQADFASFVESAAAGKEGRGSRKHALNARKLSMEITRKLKDFRTASIENDKAK